jgi:hypothetical protein
MIVLLSTQTQRHQLKTQSKQPAPRFRSHIQPSWFLLESYLTGQPWCSILALDKYCSTDQQCTEVAASSHGAAAAGLRFSGPAAFGVVEPTTEGMTLTNVFYDTKTNLKTLTCQLERRLEWRKDCWREMNSDHNWRSGCMWYSYICRVSTHSLMGDIWVALCNF